MCPYHHPQGTFAALSGTTYEVELELGAAGDVTSTIPQLSGSIEPPNAGSPSFLVRYRPTVTFELSDGLQVIALVTARCCNQLQ